MDEVQQRRRYLARGLSIAALACVAYLPVDLTWERGGEIASWRLGWIGALVFAAVAQTRWTKRNADVAAHLAAVVSGIATVAIFRLTGGSTHVAFGFVLALPLVIQVIAPEYPWAGVLTGVTTGLGGAATLVSEGRSAREVGEWALISLALSALAAAGAVGFKRVWLKELRAERERNAALERLALSERLATVGQLSAGVAHEVNNPLSFVHANIQYAIRESFAGRPMTGEVMDALREAEVGTQRVAEIVKALKIIGRASPSDLPGEIDLRQVLDSTLAIAGNEARQRARLDCVMTDVPAVIGDEVRLGQVFLNLLNNAVQAIEPGRPEANSIRVGLRRVGDRAVIEVADTGCGIPANVISRVFDPFFTTKPPGEGMGLGLALSRTTVMELGGSLEVHSEAGVGSTFRVLLPLAAEGRDANARPPCPLRAV